MPTNEYTCAACGLPIIDEDPHTAIDGEDVHEACCDLCAQDAEADRRQDLAREESRSGAADWED